VAVFPSLYEPFGIVALEGMAAGATVIASDAGGLGEIIRHGENGLKFYCDNVNSLADNIIWAIQHPDHCSKMRTNALKDIEKTYSWDKIAIQTGHVYQEIIEENQESNWHAVMHEEAAREIIMANMVKTIEAEEMTRYRDVH
jgi:Glycosyltransferase